MSTATEIMNDAVWNGNAFSGTCARMAGGVLEVREPATRAPLWTLRRAGAPEVGVISSSVSRVLAIGNRLRRGILHINDPTVGDEPHAPFGGHGAFGNGTRIGGPASWEEFTQWQSVTMQDRPAAYPF